MEHHRPVSGVTPTAGLYVFASLGQVLAVVTIDTQHEGEYNTVRWTTSEPALIVHRLCVDPEVQGQGTGRRLMEFVERYAVRQRFSSVRLDAYSGNPRALALYRQRGSHQNRNVEGILAEPISGNRPFIGADLERMTLLSMREYFTNRS